MFQIIFVLSNPSELGIAPTEIAPTAVVPRCFSRGSPCVIVQLQTPSCSGKCCINQHQPPCVVAWGELKAASFGIKDRV